jgi:hypothetical protein
MGTTGAPTEFTMGTPEDVKGLREQLIKLLSSGLSQGATPYSGPIAPQQNQMTLGAANMLSNMMGYGPYQQSGFAMNPFTSLLGGGGGGGIGEPGKLNPSDTPWITPGVPRDYRLKEAFDQALGFGRPVSSGKVVSGSGEEGGGVKEKKK